MKMESTLAEAVADFRKKEEGITQKEFAKKVGISSVSLSKIENGYRPSFAVYEKLAEELGVSAKELRVLKTKGK